MKTHRIVIGIAQAEELSMLLPTAVKQAKASGERTLVITIKEPPGPAPSPEQIKAFAAGVPRDHTNGKMG